MNTDSPEKKQGSEEELLLTEMFDSVKRDRTKKEALVKEGKTRGDDPNLLSTLKFEVSITTKYEDFVAPEPDSDPTEITVAARGKIRQYPWSTDPLGILCMELGQLIEQVYFHMQGQSIELLETLREEEDLSFCFGMGLSSREEFETKPPADFGSSKKWRPDPNEHRTTER